MLIPAYLSVKASVILAVSCVIALTVMLPLPSIAAVQFDDPEIVIPKVFKAVPLAAKVWEAVPFRTVAELENAVKSDADTLPSLSAGKECASFDKLIV